jgi:hypothetical protein
MSENTEGLTPREVRLCRDSWAAGAQYGNIAMLTPPITFVNEAARRYPMPTVEVPRVVEVAESRNASRVHRFRIVDGVMQTMVPGCTRWEQYDHEREAVALADLLATPTHRVPADEATP